MSGFSVETLASTSPHLTSPYAYRTTAKPFKFWGKTRGMLVKFCIHLINLHPIVIVNLHLLPESVVHCDHDGVNAVRINVFG